MIGWERRVLLRHYLEQGMTKTELAERFGISRQTIYRWIRSGELDRDLSAAGVHYSARAPVATKLDRYRDILVSRLGEYPDLTAVRLFEEIKAAGYAGGYTQVKEYVRKVRPRAPEEPVVRFETPPGHQGQVDFADFSAALGQAVCVFGCSWLLPRAVAAVLHTTDDAACVRGSGGGLHLLWWCVPRELLFDQMKAVVTKDERAAGGRVTENAEFLRFAHHWDFRVRACRPYRAKTKGKVERPVSYVRSSFFYGRTFTSDEDLNDQARHWLDHVANVRTHGTLKERPVDRFEHERDLLRLLASRPYRSLVLPPEVTKQAKAVLPRIDVERRPLEAYAQVAGGVR